MRLMSEERLHGVLERCQNPDFEPAYRALKGEVEAFLGVEMGPPDRPAGFYHDYFCPEHAVELVFDPAQPGAHRCPQDGWVFAGEPYDAAWRWFVNNSLSTMAFKLALIWRIEGDEPCLRRVEEILTGYADRYPGYPPGRERDYGQGKATFQSLDESVWLIPLVRAYDLIRDRLASRDRRRVEEDLFRAAAEHILEQKFHRIHNIECWHNAAIGVVGICLEDSDLIRVSLDEEFGFHHQLAEGVREDGLWWEGSSSYHFYALAALMTHVQVSEGVDDTLWRADRLKEMFRAPVALAYPDFQLPATNDCWFFSSLLEDVCHGVPPASGFYEVACGWYDEEIFSWVLNSNYSRRLRSSLEALLYGRELSGDRIRLRPAGTSFESSGFSVLRSQDAPDRQTYLMLKYGPHGGSHGHPDKLSLSFYASGRPVAPDLGTPGYGIDLHRTWYRQTLSHNTVLIDGRSQPPAEGQSVAFKSGDQEDFGVADARVSWEEAPYEGVWMRRALLWTEGYFLDFFQIGCSRERQIDWVCRFAGHLESRSDLSEGAAAALEGDGYGHISEPVTGVPEGPVRLQWGLAAGHLSVFLPREIGTEIIQGRVPGNPASDISDILIRRRRADQTAFLGLFHPWTEEPAVRKVTSLHAEFPEGVWAVQVETVRGRDLWILYEQEMENRIGLSDAKADRILNYAL